MQVSRLDFPDPEGPIIAVMLRARKDREISLKALIAP
jgi:hypothetical protein